MAKAAKSPIASRTRSRKCTAIIKKKNMFTVTINLVRLSVRQIAAAEANNLVEPSKYNLRKRIKTETQAKSTKNIKKKEKAAASTAVCSQDHMPAGRLWDILKKENDIKIEKNLCCLAKMKSYSPWPAMVLKPDQKSTEVYFFGDGTTGKVSTKEIVPFEKCLTLAKKYFHLNGYVRAVREMEITLNIPQQASITKNILSN